MGDENFIGDLVGKYDVVYCFFEFMECENELLSLEVEVDLGFVILVFVIGLFKIICDFNLDVIDLLICLNFGYEEFFVFLGLIISISEDENLI